MSCKLIARINPFDASKRIVKDIEPKSLRGIYDDLALPLPLSHARFLINDRICTDTDEVPQDGDIVFINVVPGSGDNNVQQSANTEKIAGTLIAIGGAILIATGVGTPFGIALLGAGLGMVAGGVVLYHTDLSIDPRDQAKSAPNIRGSRNKTNYNGPVPLVLGTHRIAPHNGAMPYTEIIGNNQYLHQLFVLGCSRVTVDSNSWKIGDTPLSKYENVSISVETAGGFLPDYPYIVRETTLSRILAKQNEDGSSGDILITTPTNTRQLTIDFAFNGLVKFDDDNDKKTRTVSIAADYKVAGAPDTEYKTIETREVSAATTNIIRVVMTRVLDNENPSGVDYSPSRQYDVRLRRLTDDSTESNIIDKCYAGSVRAIEFSPPINPTVQADLCVAVLKIKASDQLSGVIDQLSCVVSSVVLDYDGVGTGPTAWSYRATSNPASLYLHVLTDTKVNPRPKDLREINWAELEAWHSFCQSKGYQCDMIVDQDIDRDTLLVQIAQCGRAIPVRVGGKYYCIVDKAKISPMQIFSPRNSWGYSGSKAFPDYPHALKLNFINKDLDYQEDQVIVYDDGYNADGSDGKLIATKFQEIDTKGIVQATHAWKEGRYKIAAARLRPETHELTAPAEYLTCTIGDRVKFSHDVILVGHAWARISSVTIDAGYYVALRIDEEVLIEDGKDYAIEIRTRNGIKTARVTAPLGYTQDLTLLYALPEFEDIRTGDLSAFGEYGLISIDAVIMDITPQDDLAARLTMVEYAPEIFDLIDDPALVIPPHNPKISKPGDTSGAPVITSVYDPYKTIQDLLSNTTAADAAILTSSIRISCSAPVVFMHSDGSYTPEMVTFTAAYKDGTPYLGRWRIYRGGALEYESTADEPFAVATSDIILTDEGFLPSDDLTLGSSAFRAVLYAAGGTTSKLYEYIISTISDANGISQAYADAAAELARITAEAYADAQVSQAEAAAIGAAQAAVDAALAESTDLVIAAHDAAQAYAAAQAHLAEITAVAYADGVADAAEAAAILAAQAAADAAETAAKAYADGVVTDAEAAAIAAAQAYADAAADAAEVSANAYADGVVSAEEARAIADAQAKLEEAKQYADAAAANAVEDANAAVPTYTPKYIGTTTDNPPSVLTFAAKVPGDWCLSTTAKQFYLWTGSAWTTTGITTAHRMAALQDMLSIADASDTTSFVQTLVAVDAFINKLFSKYIKLQTGGSIRGGDRYDASGNLVDGNVPGFWLGADGILKARDAYLDGGLYAYGVPFMVVAAFNFTDNAGTAVLLSGKNISSLSRFQQGGYRINFTTPIKVRYYIGSDGYRYIDMYVIGNSHSTFESGFDDVTILTINWVRNYIDGRLSFDSEFAYVTYADIYVCDNNYDQLLAPKVAQGVIAISETRR